LIFKKIFNDEICMDEMDDRVRRFIQKYSAEEKGKK
jgi:hypothetical protein